MLRVFDRVLPCPWAILEYAEGNKIDEFDLTFPSNDRTISQLIAPRYPHLVNKFNELRSVDPSCSPTIDSFLDPKEDPTIATFTNPDKLLDLFGLEANIIHNKAYFATVAYLGRNFEVRVVYRDPQTPKSKTNVHDKDGIYLYDEYLYTGDLPRELNWAKTIQTQLSDKGIKNVINHYKLNKGYPKKVYFRISP